MRKNLKFFIKFLGVLLLCSYVSAELDSSIEQDAFESSLGNTFPLTSNQIDVIKKTFDKETAALSEPVVPNPIGQTSTRNISLAPGSEIPVVRLAKGYISTLVFMDSTGQPWPIANYSIGDPRTFNIQWDTESNVLFVQPQVTFAHGNIGIRLAGSPTPVMIQLACGRSNIDYRLDFTLPGDGPFAKPSEMSYKDPAYHFDSVLSQFLDGKSIAGATPLSLTPNVGQAWLYNGSIILRLKSPIISPKWHSYSSSSDGMKVYKISATNTFVISSAGKTQTVRIEGL